MRLFEKTPEAMTGSRIAAVDYAKTLAIVCVVMIPARSCSAGRSGALRGWKACSGAALQEARFRCF